MKSRGSSVASTEQTGCECGRSQLADTQIFSALFADLVPLHIIQPGALTSFLSTSRQESLLVLLRGPCRGRLVCCERAVCSCRCRGFNRKLTRARRIRRYGVHSRVLLLLLGEPVFIWFSACTLSLFTSQHDER